MYKTISIHSRSTYWADKASSAEMSVDSDELAKEIQSQTNQLYDDGYEVVSVIPVNSGNLSNGTGYLQTESVIVFAKKRNSNQ